MLTLYGFSRVNELAHGRTRDLRALWALEEMGLPFELQGMDHPRHALDDAEYRRMNPFGQIPVLDDDGVVVAESGAVVLYLAETYGRLIPEDAAGRAQVMRWCFAALNTVELPMTFLVFLDIVGENGDAMRGDVTKLAHRFLTSLEAWLEGRTFVATDDFTVADILMTHVVSEIDDDALYAPYPRVRAYRERNLARPAWKKVIAAYCARVEATHDAA